jgi:hypothetical protein
LRFLFLQSVVVDISSGEESACQKDSAPEAPKDFLAPVSALVTLQDPILKALKGPATLVDATVTLQGPREPVATALDIGPSLEGPAITSSTISLPPKGARLQEPTAASSAITPPSERVSPQEPIIASPAVIAPPSEDAFSGADQYFISCRYSSSRTGLFYLQIVYIFPRPALLTRLLSRLEPLGVACV